MRLSAIKFAGFKSFAEPVTLRVPGNLTGIVGPNGCGKSNVIDAVRWVTGEMSAKQLRGQAAQDVIFNGSRSRKPVGRCSVELTFDNGDGRMAGQYAAFAEISVKRELSRDGNSHYRINGARCRRRDIVDLFLGTGLGGRANYAIIEQGMISQLIDAKPEELRLMLEEAAGISKYKERRRETESRIRDTRENLARLDDILGELRKRLSQLQRQAANAERYTELKAVGRKLKAELIVLRARALDGEADSSHQAAKQATAALEACREGFTALETQREQLRGQSNAAAQSCQELQGQFYTAQAELSRAEQALEHARERQRAKQGELAGLEREIELLSQRSEQETARRSAVATRIEELAAEITRADASEAETQQRVSAAEAAAAAALQGWDAFSQSSQAPLAERASEQTRVEQLQRQLQAAARQQQQLEQEQQGINTQPLLEGLAAVEKTLAELAQRIESSRTAAADKDQQLSRLREQRSDVEAQLHQVRANLQDWRGRLASLEALQQAALREDDPELQAWLEGRNWQQLQRLAQTLEVEAGWERAAEAALGDFLQALCVEKLSSTATPSDWPATAMLLVEADEAEGEIACVAHSLAARVKGPAVIRSLLGSVYAVEDEAEAQQVRSQLQPGQMLVTRAGLCVAPLWLRYAGGAEGEQAGHAGVLAREQALRTLRKDIHSAQQRAGELEKELAEVRAAQQQAEQQRRELGNTLQDASAQHSRKLASQQADQARLEQQNKRMAAIEAGLADVCNQSSALQQELTQAQVKLETLQAQSQAIAQQREQHQQTLRQQRTELDRVRQDAEQGRMAGQRLRLELASQKTAVEAADKTLQDLQQRLESLGQRRHSAQGELTSAADSFAKPEATRASASAQREALSSKLEAARQQQAQLNQQAEQVAARARQAETEVEAARNRLSQAEMSQQAAQLKRQSLIDQLQETGFEFAPLAAELDEHAQPAEWEEQLQSNERRIARLGPINLAAMGEFEQEQQRATDLAAQHADLSEALTMLEDAMRKIDKETRQRFKETFEQVRAHFLALFPKLFGGGEAQLELTSDDALEAGVVLMARPPGKRNSSLQLLSGGEKAMTAVALLFALFELNPAPFCMLDEVDAPLDDANVGRFCELVREMAHNVQFIVITHNKVTMEMMDQINGVTMQEPGVSRLVSVDVAEALALAS